MNFDYLERYFDKEGNSITLWEWAKLLENPKYKIVRQTVLPNGKWVSTVWLGMNYNLGGGEPLIFETMVFPTKGNFEELDCQRYSTLLKAKRGHQRMIKKWNK